MSPQELLARLRTFLADLGDRRVGERRLRDLSAADLGLARIDAGGLLDDLRVALAFYTRIPVPGPRTVEGGALARAAWCTPLAGALIGALAGLAYWIAWRLNLSPFVCATLAVGAALLITGCLHEDGLADMADGFGGGATRERVLAIMHDGRIGAFGTCALAIALLVRIGVLADLPNPGLAGWALVGAPAAARAGLPLVMRLVPPARPDGLAAEAGAPSGERAGVALLIGIVLLVVALGVRNALIASVLMLVAGAILAGLARRRIGGQTGDVLGAIAQVCECLVLLVAAARF